MFMYFVSTMLKFGYFLLSRFSLLRCQQNANTVFSTVDWKGLATTVGGQ
jgi:hypothetical protein